MVMRFGEAAGLTFDCSETTAACARDRVIQLSDHELMPAASPPLSDRELADDPHLYQAFAGSIKELKRRVLNYQKHGFQLN